MVLAPAATMFSMALIWPAVSPSCLPAAVNSLAPSFLASASAPSFIFTKKGLLSVLVIRPMTGSAAMADVMADAASASALIASMDFFIFVLLGKWIFLSLKIRGSPGLLRFTS